MSSIPVAGLNHAVLYVRDLDVAVDFYKSVFGFEVVDRIRNFACFLRAAGGSNHHDLGLFAVGPAAPRPPRGSTGLYHLAWEVPRIEDLALAAQVLTEAGATITPNNDGIRVTRNGAGISPVKVTTAPFPSHGAIKGARAGSAATARTAPSPISNRAEGKSAA